MFTLELTVKCNTYPLNVTAIGKINFKLKILNNFHFLLQVVLSLVRTFSAFVAVTVTSMRKALLVVIAFIIFRLASKPFFKWIVCITQNNLTARKFHIAFLLYFLASFCKNYSMFTENLLMILKVKCLRYELKLQIKVSLFFLQNETWCLLSILNQKVGLKLIGLQEIIVTLRI